MRSRFTTVALATLLLVGLMAPAVLAGNHQTNPLQGIPVTGTLIDDELERTFEGTLDITGFSRDGRQLLIEGVLSGTLNDGTEVSQEFDDVPLNASGECPILFLDIGPIFLDLLGLQVDLSQIVLDITAVSGPGRLLGNLLCAIVGLLDGPPSVDAALDRLIDQLNRLLARLFG